MHTAFKNFLILIAMTSKLGGNFMATLKRVFTLRLDDEIFDKIEKLAKEEHRSMTNLIEFILLKYFDEIESKE